MRNKIRKDYSRGFTLIELLFVVLIIGILASIILANYGPARQQARDARRVSDVSQAQTALESYFGDPINGSTYPPSNNITVGANGVSPAQPILPCRPYVSGKTPTSIAGGLNCLVEGVSQGGNPAGGYLPAGLTDPQTGISYDYYSCDPADPNSSLCKNTDAGAPSTYYQAYCVGAHLENAKDEATPMAAAVASCSGSYGLVNASRVSWCPILNNPSAYNNDNYVVCRK